MTTEQREVRYRQVLTLRKANKTFQEIADELKLTRTRAHQLYLDALNGVPIKRKRSRTKSVVARKARRQRI